ncbi:unnamed protein product [marine sediment metagenome]|uniref:Transposase n=1 Tax=marine sediment metagenome TaxID=412755 RepID=X0YCK9_9ZZZZ
MYNSTKSVDKHLTEAEIPDPEVSVKKPRRTFTASFKLQILKDLDACENAEQRNALLRREGLYSSRISTWRKERAAGILGAQNKKRGRKRKHDAKDEQIKSLENQISRLEQKLDQAATIIDVQKKVSAIFGVAMKDSKLSDKH